MTRSARRLLVGTSVLALVLGLGPLRAQDVGIRPARSPSTLGLDNADFETAEYFASYGLAQINASTAYARGYTGRGVLVAVYDSGIDAGHPEFAGRISSASRSFFTANVPVPSSLIQDTDGHGTHVSGTIGAARDGQGMMGVAFESTNLTLYNLPSDRDKQVYPKIKADGDASIDLATQQGAKVFNGSYGPVYPTRFLCGGTPTTCRANPEYKVATIQEFGPDATGEFEAVQRAAQSGMLLVFAAGNDRQDQPIISVNPSGAALYPFIKPSNAGSGVYRFVDDDDRPIDQSRIDFSSLSGFILSVVAVDQNNRIASFSNFCGVTAEWCLAAPGVRVLSTYPRGTGNYPDDNDYSYSDGTSMAAPHVAGAAAVLVQAFPFLTAPQIAQILLTTATDIGPHEIFGWGLLNLGKAIDGPAQFTSTWNVDTQGYYGTFANDISGVGGLIKTGPGTLELTGFNTFTGGVAVNGGTLKVGLDFNLGAAGTGISFGGGTLQTSGGFDSDRPITLNTSGTFQIDGGIATLSGVIADGRFGPGSLVKTGPGTLDLAAANTYTGSTTISSGTLALVGSGSIASSSLVQADGTFDISGVSGSGTSIQTLAGRGAVALGGRTLTITNGSTTFAGAIGGSGGVALAGGSQTFAGANTYTGATAIAAGAALTLSGSLVSPVSVAASGRFTNAGLATGGVTNAGTFVNSGLVSGGLANTGNVTASGGRIDGAIANRAGLFTVSGSVSSNGAFANAAGASLAVSGTGAYGIGGSLGNAGSLSVAAGGTLFAVGGTVNSGTIAVAGALGGGLSNTGTVTLSAGRLDGQIENRSGSITVTGAAATAGNVLNAAQARLAVTETGGYSIAGLLTNAGAVTIARGGVLSAGAIVNTGLLVDEGRVDGDLFNTGTLVLNGQVTGTLTNGPGASLQLTGQVVSFAGFANEGTTDFGGRLVTIGALSGTNPLAVLANARLTVGDATSSSYAGSIVDGSGQSSLAKIGSGTLTLAGASTYTGPTTIAGGILAVNGSITSPVTVGSAGTLRGTGFIAAPVTVAGVLAPGNSPGTLVVAGPVTFASGSTFSLDIDGTGTGSGAGNYARLFAVGPAGTVAAAGTIQPVLRGITGSATNTYTPALGQRFGVLATSGGLTGSFAGIAQPASGLPAAARFDALYGTNALDLVVTPSAYGNLAANGLSQSGNARAVGAAIDGARPVAGVRPDAARQPFYDALYGTAPALLGGGLASLSGQTYGDALMSDLAARRLLSATIDRHLTLGGGGVSLRAGESGGRTANPVFDLRQDAGVAQTPLAIGEGRVWADGIYGFGNRTGDRNASGARFDTGGVVAGIDRRVGQDTLVGGAFSYLRNVGSSGQGASAFEPGRFATDSFAGTLYGTTRFGDVELRGQVGAGYTAARVDRLSSLGSYVRRSSGSPDGANAGGSAFLGYRIGTGLAFDVIPELGFSYDYLTRSGVTERGGTTISLGGVRLPDLVAARSLLGGRIASLPLGDREEIRFDARAYWAHELADTAALIRQDIFGQAFTTRTSRPGRDGAVMGLGISGALAPGARLTVGYTGELRPGANAHAFTAGLNVTW